MKKTLLALLVTVCAFAAEKPLVSKTSGGGFVMPEYAGYERCDLYADRVVITHQYGRGTPTSLQVNEVKTLAVSGDLALVIEKAQNEQISEKPNSLCDGPSTSIIANEADSKPVVLFSTGGCGSPRKERVGPLSSKLREIINLYCPKTFDFSNRE